MKNLLLALIRLYQLTLSSILGPRCRFYPSCSAYASEAINHHGIARGIGLSVRRICKCHPYHPGGYDPVPGIQEIGLDKTMSDDQENGSYGESLKSGHYSGIVKGN